ncbi:Mannan endo-1,4-beta-mannosidase protein [Dioscorea alata]|uniref:Mannan endo-1,4-beta-mannosidase protein n=1 Tax=Dioscorea alata TaxID=55571 RepID=A0ACB7W1D1_DIOAL|nr:Mannan endo-1,4-beta-mannosidase protein [Dioscorea alata]
MVKGFKLLSLLITLTLLQALTVLASDASSNASKVLPIHSDFVSVDPRNKFILQGSPFLFNGFNSYWMMSVAANPSDMHKISDVFSQAASTGLTVCRTWAFSDGGPGALQISPGVYDEKVFQALDFVIAEARRNKIYLILSLVNNYKDYGGRAQYVQWARDAGEAVNGEDDFYVNPVVKQYYKNHVMKILTRKNTISKVVYKDDPTIMAWELINEPRCQIDPSGKTLDAWVREMAAYAKSIDEGHLLEIGMEGFYGDSRPEKKTFNHGIQVGTDFISSHLVPQIDFATIHVYPDLWFPEQNDTAQIAFAREWMRSHWDDARTILNKPLVLAEFGKSKKDPGYTVHGRDMYMSSIYEDIYGFAMNGGTFGGGLVWQVFGEGMESYYDGFEIVFSQNLSTNVVIIKQSQVMAVLSHRLRTNQEEEKNGDEEMKNKKNDEVKT